MKTAELPSLTVGLLRQTTMASKNDFKPRMSDEAVAAKTGKNWSRWFKHLDAAGAKQMTHQEIDDSSA